MKGLRVVDRGSSPWSWGPPLVAMGATALIVLQVNRAGNLSLGYFYDEMWRVAFIRSPDPRSLMLAHDTPLPPGWVAVMKAATALLPDSPVTFRLAALAPVPLAAALWSVLLGEVLRRPAGASVPGATRLGIDEPGAALIAGAAPILLAALPALAGHYYLNNYGFEVLYLAAMLLAAALLGRRRGALVALAVLVALAPLFVLGGLLALPAFVACGGRHALGGDDRRRIGWIGGGAGVAGVLGVALYVGLYRPVASKPTITDWWLARGSSLGGSTSLLDLTGATARQVVDGLVPGRIGPLQGLAFAAAVMAVLAASAAGIAFVGARWPWLLVIPVSAQLLALPASLVTSWPVTLERVNLCFQAPVLLVIVAGGLRLVLWPLGARTVVRAGALGLAVLLAVPRPMLNDPHDFARGLTADLDVVASSPSERNLVLAYHWMSWLYAHDRLVTTAADGRFTIVRDRPGSRALYDEPIDRLVAQHGLGTGDRVWCVLPRALADDQARACPTRPDGRLREVERHTTIDSTIVGYEVMAGAATVS